MNKNPKHIKILERLLKLPENKECAECKSKAPRWASINLGIFICLRCSGVHRSLGVHISKVRSTTLDTWLPEQVSYLQSMGNCKSNTYWEAELPLHYDRSQIEDFIRAKYVEKRWITKDCKDNSPSKSKQELMSSQSVRCYGSSELTSSRSSRIYGSNQLSSRSSRIYGNNQRSSRSSRRYAYGCVAEWTNSQHMFKEKNDCSMGENVKVDSKSDDTGEMPKDRADSKIQHQEKKENCQPSMDEIVRTDLESVSSKPSKELAHVVRTLSANGSMRKSEHETSKIKPSTLNVLPAVHSPKADYADELFRTLYVDESIKNASNCDTNEWVRFDCTFLALYFFCLRSVQLFSHQSIFMSLIYFCTADQESSTPKAAIVSNEIIHEARLNPRSVASKINTEPKIEDIQTAKVPSLKTENLSERQKEVTSNRQSLSEKPNKVLTSSTQLHRVGMLVQGVSSTDVSKLPCNVNSFERQSSLNGRSVELTTSTQMPMQNFQAVNSTPYTMPSLYRPAVPHKGVSIASARGSSTAIPKSGYDYDFSYLTQGMFAKR